jgi:hypothetical protein
VDGEERLKAELMLLVAGAIGDETLVGGGAHGGAPGNAGDADAKPENSSDANRSFGIPDTAGLAVVTDGCVTAKFNPFEEARIGLVGTFD